MPDNNNEFFESLGDLTVEELRTLRPILSLTAHFNGACAGRSASREKEMDLVIAGRSHPAPIRSKEIQALRGGSYQKKPDVLAHNDRMF